MYGLFGNGNTPYNSGGGGGGNPFGGILSNRSSNSGGYQATGTSSINSGVGSGLFGFFASIASALLNNSMAQDRESFARQENYQLGEKAADNADARTRKLYEDLMSPASLLQQYKDAELSPSLMFGGGGVGGQTPQGAQGTGASGVSPTTYGVNFDPTTLSQIKLADAQAAKLNAETDTIEGKNERGKLQLKDILSSIGVKDADAKLTNFNRELAEVLKCTTIKTAEQNLNRLYASTEKLWYEATAQLYENQFTIESFNDKLNRIKLENTHLGTMISNTLADTALKGAEKELVKQKIIQSVEEIAIGWYKTGLEERRVGAYESWCSNMGSYLRQQVDIAKERLEHDIHLDWAKFGLNCGEFLETCVKDYIGTMFEQIGTLMNTDALKLIK